MYYWFAILDNIGLAIGVLIFICVFATIVTFAAWLECKIEEDEEVLLKWIKREVVIFVILLSLQIFIPNQKQMAFIIAAPYIVENQELRDASKNTAEIIKLGTEYLKEALKVEGK